MPVLAEPARLSRNDFAQDLSYDHQYEDSDDSAINQKNFKRFIDLEMKYRTMVKQEQVNNLRDHHRILEMELEKKSMEKTMLLILLALGSVALVTFAYLYGKLRHAKELIQHKNEELEELISIKNRLFSIVAHDLKTPLNSIVGFSSLLSASVSIDAQKVAEYAERIKNSGIRGSEMIEKLLDWSRLNLDAIHQNLSRHDLHEIALDACVFLTDYAEMKKVRIKNEIPPGTFVWCDRNSVGNVLRNLLSNAVKYSHQESQIWLMAGKQKDKVIISVIDNGMGVPLEYQDRLFADKPILSTPGTQDEKGTGIGLLLSKEFILSNKGKIWFRSFPGQGSSFFISLPSDEKTPVQHS